MTTVYDYDTQSSRRAPPIDTRNLDTPLRQSGPRPLPSIHSASRSTSRAPGSKFEWGRRSPMDPLPPAPQPAGDDSDTASIASTSSSSSSIRFAKSTIESPLFRLTNPRPRPTTPAASSSSESHATPVSVVDKRWKKMGKPGTRGSHVPEVAFDRNADARLLPSKVVVPNLLSALAPAHERKLVEAKAKAAKASPRPQSRSTHREPVASLSPYAHSHPSLSPYTPSSSYSWNSSYSTSPRSPHYVKASHTWNNPELRIDERTSKTPARPSLSSSRSDDGNGNRFISRHFEVAVPPYGSPRSASPMALRAISPLPPPRSSADTNSDSEEERHYRSTRRKEAGWSGEWSGAGARGMGDVVAKLRGLKMK
ncbi:hypothetical protein C8R46DRAFT_1128266 [Mycena filopes]|nr:hypothetical protein C8R46DRAFT_1128266 [Mycena filopes]